jgi:hypothetical protein
MGFNNPLTGLNGSLIYPQIKSPNFDLATQTGWAILKNGNAYFFNVVATGTITASEFIGTDFIIDSAGMFFYNGTPAAGNLILALAPVSGTDAFGNNYGAGFTAGATGSQEQIRFGVLAGSPLEFFLSGISTALNNAALMLNVAGAGSAAHDTLVVKSSQDTAHVDYSAIQLTGNSNDGVTQSTQLQFAYVDTSGTPHFYLTQNEEGLSLPAASIVAIQPGVLPAVGEVWHSPTILAGWTITGAANPVRYRLLPDGNVQLSGEVLTTAANASGTNIFTMGAGYIPAFQCSFVTESSIAVGAGMATVTVLNASGNVKCQQAFTGAGQILRFDGIIYPTT